MDRLQHIFEVIAKEGFADEKLQENNNYVKDIQNGREDFFRFNLSEHAGLSKGGAPLIGASIVACYAQRSLTAGGDAKSSEGSSPASKGFRDNWNGQGVNYISDRLALEDMHPANVFIDVVTGKPICIDCIVKFVK